MTWQLQEAKNRFSEVVKAAESKGPQVITVRGQEAVVVVSINEYKRLAGRQQPLSEFLSNSPLKGLALDLRRPRDVSDRDMGR